MKGHKRPNSQNHDEFLESNPVPEKYQWMMCKKPAGATDRVFRVSAADAGVLWAHFSSADFHFSCSEVVQRVLNELRNSQSPLKRIGAILKSYGIEMSGLSNLQFGLIVLSLAIARDQREAAEREAAR